MAETKSLEKRLTRQLASSGRKKAKSMAIAILKKRGDLNKKGKLTAKGRKKFKCKLRFDFALEIWILKVYFELICKNQFYI